MYNLIAHWNETAHKVAWMPLDFNEERERAMFEEEYQEFLSATTPAEKLDALADMMFLCYGIIYKWGSMGTYTMSRYEECLKTMKFKDDFKYNVLPENTQPIRTDIVNIALAEVIKANYTRFWEWCYIREDGKFIKSPNYQQPDLQWIVDTYWITFS